MRTGLTRVIAVALTFVPTTAFAHAGHGHAHGFIHGFAHPLSGLDHVLVMIAIGIVAWQFVRRAFWLLPATFAMALTLGGILAITHTSTPATSPMPPASWRQRRFFTPSASHSAWPCESSGAARRLTAPRHRAIRGL